MSLSSLLKFVGAFAAAYLIVVVLAWFFQRKLIYLPMGRVPPVTSVLPGAQEVTFETVDGLRLGAWFQPAFGQAAKATVLVLNGNAGNRSFRAPLAEALARSGLSVLLFDYRGYGGNAGSPNEQGLVADAHAARAYLESRPDVEPGRIVYFGESLGAAVAVAAATEHQPAALVLRSPFTSLTSIGKMHYFFLPVGRLLEDRYPSIDRIGRLRCPVLAIAGDRDGIVPASESRALFDAAQAASRRFVLLRGVDHNDYEFLAGTTMIREVTAFLDEVLPPAGVP